MCKSIDLSIIIPCRNSEHSITAMLDSIYRQKNLAYEIIVVDDASTDKTVEVVESWAKKNTPITILKNTERLYSLQSRIKGFKAAKSENIMTVDADDILLGTNRLAKAIKEKDRMNAEILHFRTVEVSADLGKLGEFIWGAPFYDNKNPYIKNERIFEIYTSFIYNPAAIWGKIFSKSLVKRIIPIAEKHMLMRADIKLLTPLLMLNAHSYLAYDEYIYEYKRRDNVDWTFEVRFKDVQALLIIERVIEKCMLEKNISEKVQKQFISFNRRRIVIYCGYISLTAYNNIKNKQLKSNDFYKMCLEYFDEETLFSLMLYATKCNITTLRNKKRVICDYAQENSFSNIEDLLSDLMENYKKLQEQFEDKSLEKLSYILENIFTLFDNSSYIDIVDNNKENISALLNYATRKDYIFILLAVNSYVIDKIRKLCKYEVTI